MTNEALFHKLFEPIAVNLAGTCNDLHRDTISSSRYGTQAQMERTVRRLETGTSSPGAETAHATERIIVTEATRMNTESTCRAPTIKPLTRRGRA